ncbi:hypothetical protein [Rubrivirga sp. IMCC43871]|uniref:hypothetical protein n=1 Tax=Rubrivirga sp. IMCC43871 TaxID=3391575 RepID=UPI00398FC3E8
MDDRIYLIIAVTFFGFLALAFILLFPVWRFIRRQERVADDWTPDAIARRQTAARAAPPPDEPEPPAS